LFIRIIAFLILIGIFKSLANPFPDPTGIIARIVLVLMRLFPTSLTDPSPPTATITLYLLTFSEVMSIACLARFVYSISALNLVLSK